MRIKNQSVLKRKNSVYFKIAIVVIILTAILVFVNLSGFDNPLKGFFYQISSPLQKAFWKSGNNFSKFFYSLWNANNLQKENDDLRNKLGNLAAENSFLREVKKENDLLREALQLDLQKDFKLTLANVVSRDLSQDAILLDKGANRGITKGMPVITSGKYLIGRVSDVYDNFSRVILISGKESAFDAKLVEKNVLGLVKGQGNAKILFTLIPRDSDIKEGDKIITVDKGGIFPAGIYVGEIGKIFKSDTEPFFTAKVNLVGDYYDFTEVFVVSGR